MPTQTEWTEISGLSGPELKGRVFSVLQQAASDIQTKDRDDPDVLSVVPRLAGLIETKSELSSFKEAFSALARSAGLWNYIDRSSADFHEQMIAEAVTVPELDYITLHREQVDALNKLFSGSNLILSAPTSFGKSVLIDALIASGKYKRIAIVLPTIALLDEFRRRLNRRFSAKFPIIMYHSEEAPPQGNVIFLGTQERLVNRNDLGQLDIAIVDEFYKLDPSRQDDRSMILNAAVYQLLRRSRQFFFLGPNIENIRFSSGRWEFAFLRTRFSTVAVDTYDLRGVADREGRLFDEAVDQRNWPALIFVSSPDRANQLGVKLADRGSAIGDGREFAHWVDENFGAGWELAHTIRHGVGLHHGRVPRAVASHLVRLFNAGQVPVLICTSTLIEGVNTAAKSVLIYDKAINREDFDFFTFSNIRGRAGRLGQHHVGAVYLFNDVPAHDAFEVQAPLFEDFEQAPDDLVVHISDDERTPAISDRLRELGRVLDLNPDELRLASTVGLEIASTLKAEVRKAAVAGANIFWVGRPRYPEILATCQVLCKAKRANDFGAYTPAQLALYISRLMRPQSFRDFFHWYTENKKDEPNKDGLLRFLRACEYGLPQLLAVMQMFVKRIRPEVDYNYMLGELPRWFRPEVLKNLDEQGIPVQISERFYADGDSVGSLAQRLQKAAADAHPQLTLFERRWITDALAIATPAQATQGRQPL